MPSPETLAGAPSKEVRDREPSFEDSLTARSAEFEAERLKPSASSSDPQAVEVVGNEEASALDVPDTHTVAKKAAALSAKGKAKMKMEMGKGKMDPFAAMYDPYVMMAMRQQQMLAMQASWADTENDEEDWWYLGFMAVAVWVRYNP